MAERIPSSEGVAARRAALQMLDSVFRRGRTLDAAAEAASRLPERDRALALAIAGETLRRLPTLDELIDSATKKRLPDDSKARTVLRLALAQKIAMDVPDHALIATALPLVDGGPRRLVHGVLGTLLRRGLPPAGETRLPAEVEARWAEAWGGAAVEAARRLIVQRPPLDLTFKSDSAARAFAGAAGGASLAPRHVRLAGGGSVPDLPGFETGDWWVQDLAASVPARLVPAGAGAVLDLCAAPGGKAMQLAAAGHDVTAVDISDTRLQRLATNLGRTALSATLVAADILDWQPERQFDAILLDAPCSATGTFRRHPEVLYRARPRIIAESAHLQARLLARAAQWLKPGGALVYSVCSLEPEEGERVIADFLAKIPGYRVAPPDPISGWLRPTSEGFLRILPSILETEGGLDGFFAARLVRGD